MIWGDGTATDAMTRAFTERGYQVKATENGLRFEVYPPDHSRRHPRPPLAVLWCPLTPEQPFSWLTPELAGRDPRTVPVKAWPELYPYACDGRTVPFELAREVVATIEPRGGEQDGEAREEDAA